MWSSVLIFSVLSLAAGSTAMFRAGGSPNPGVAYLKRELAAQPFKRQDNHVTNENCRFASQAHIEDVWNNLYNGSWGGFFRNFHDEIDWTVMYTQPLAGLYEHIPIRCQWCHSAAGHLRRSRDV